MARSVSITVSAALLVAGQLEVWVGGAAGGSWPASISLAVAALVLVVTRQAPLRCAAAVLASQSACAWWVEPDAVTFWVVNLVAWYGVGRWANPRRGLVGLGVVCLVAVALVTPRTFDGDWVNVYLSVTLTGFVVPWLVGFLVRTRVDAADRQASRRALGLHPGPVESGRPDVSRLSPRERDVFRLLADGATNTEIADELVLSVYTVKSHVAQILSKLGLRDRVQVVLYAHHPDALTKGDALRH